jgi:hypothetical protein
MEPREQYLRFTDYRYLTETFGNVITFKMKALLSLIAHRAATLGAFEAVRICQTTFR